MVWRILLVVGIIWLSADRAWAQSRSVQVGGTDLIYELTGAGYPIVLIHGWAHDHRSWDLQVQDLAAAFQVLRYDRRGFGRSQGHADISNDPIDLAEVLHHLGIESVHVVGHSQGALVALRFALTFPQKVRCLVLYGSPPPAGFGVPWTGSDRLPPGMARIAREYGLDSLGTVLFNHPISRGFVEGTPGSILAGLLWQGYSGQDLLDPHPSSNATPASRFEDLPNLDLPTLAVTGEWEMPYFQVAADALAYALPRGRRSVIRGGGHSVHLQQPREFTNELLRFLQGEGCTT